ncbi:unnamed protein product [Cunninghamella blakesleeana]
MDEIIDDTIFNNYQQQQPLQKIDLANFEALKGLNNYNTDQLNFNDDDDIIFSDDDDKNINIRVKDSKNANTTNDNKNVNNNNDNKKKNTQFDQSNKDTTINSQCLSDIIGDSQSTIDDDNTSLRNTKDNSLNNNNNNNNSNNSFQISSFLDKNKIPIKKLPTGQQQNKKTLYNQPTFSLANNSKNDTLIELKNLANNYHNHSFKKDGLANAALDYIKSETNEYQHWQQSIKIAMAKHGTIAKIWKQWKDSRLCRLINVWSENGMILAWCVDMNEDEENLLTKSHDSDDGNVMKKDTILEIDTQPTISLPAYHSDEDNRQPYLCIFSFAYDYFHSKSAQTKLLNAEYIAIWPPWTAIPITLNNEVYHVHIITRFVLDDYF